VLPHALATGGPRLGLSEVAAVKSSPLALYVERRPRLLRTPRLSRIAFGCIAALTPTFTGTSIVFTMRRAAARTVPTLSFSGSKLNGMTCDAAPAAACVIAFSSS